eukprot:536200-Amphidinium_carterae.1
MKSWHPNCVRGDRERRADSEMKRHSSIPESGWEWRPHEETVAVMLADPKDFPAVKLAFAMRLLMRDLLQCDLQRDQRLLEPKSCDDVSRPRNIWLLRHTYQPVPAGHPCKQQTSNDRVPEGHNL